MTTQCFLGNNTSIPASSQFSLGTNAPRLRDGTGVGWSIPGLLLTTRGSGVLSSDNTATVTGATSGIEIEYGSAPMQWVSPPLNADVTISGTITVNLWAAENNMSANVAINAIIERISSTGAIVSTIAQTARVTELAVTTAAVNNFTVTPTSTNMLKGDRIRVRVYGDDAGTMATGFTFFLSFCGTSAAADGDSYVTFTETFGFLTTDPTTTTLYPTTTVSDINPSGADEREAWTSRGAGSTNAVTNTAAGWTGPLAVTDSAGGGNTIIWYSKPLSAFTLTAPVLANIRALESNASANASIRAELDVTASDGTGATVWAATTHPTELTTSDAAYTFYVAGDDLAITDGQRLRLRLWLDDSSVAAMATAFTVTVTYAGTSAAAAGDTYLIFGQSLTQYVAAGKAPPFGANRHLSLNHLIRR